MLDILFASLSLALIFVFAATLFRFRKHNKKRAVERHHYLRGLNYFLEDETDQALQSLLDIAESSPETAEIQLALAVLFRRKGEVDRAIQIHQALMSRKNLRPEHRVKAMSGLGEDFMKAGLLDRAEMLFEELVSNGVASNKVLDYLVSIYEQEKEWKNAINSALRLERQSEVRMGKRIAHYYCELAQEQIRHHEIAAARDYLTQALAKDPECARATVLDARACEDNKDSYGALKKFKRSLEQDPELLALVIPDIVRLYRLHNDEQGLYEFLRAGLDGRNSLTMGLALTEIYQKREGNPVAVKYLNEHSESHPSLAGLSMLLHFVDSDENPENLLTEARRVVKRLQDKQSKYCCQQCGFAGQIHHWRCPGCASWNSVKPVQ